MNRFKLKVMISGGGTGGHIFPAIAIANALKAIGPHVDIMFVGAKGRMEMEKVPAAGYPIEGLWISGIQRKLTISNLMFPVKLIISLIKAGKLIQRFCPDVVVGVGGYASGPLLYMAVKKGLPTLIQEQNSYPGITNRLLARKVKKVCVAYPGMEKYFPAEKVIITGNPVRQDILQLEGKRARGLEFFKLSGTQKIILVVGGSLGAKTINESIKEGLEKFATHAVQLIWQTGKLYYNNAKSQTDSIEGKGVRVYDFITKMDYAYAVADIVISRAGAGSVSELSLVKKPAILVPSPNVAEDHQTKNAMALVSHQAAIMIKDNEAKQKLVDVAISLVNDNEKQEKLKRHIASLALTNAAETIANEVIRLAKQDVI